MVTLYKENHCSEFCMPKLLINAHCPIANDSLPKQLSFGQSVIQPAGTQTARQTNRQTDRQAIKTDIFFDWLDRQFVI